MFKIGDKVRITGKNLKSTTAKRNVGKILTIIKVDGDFCVQTDYHDGIWDCGGVWNDEIEPVSKYSNVLDFYEPVNKDFKCLLK